MKVYIFGFLFICAVCQGQARSTAGEFTSTRETILDTQALDRDAGLVDLRIDRIGKTIQLDDRDLIEDDSPGSGRGPNWKGITPWAGQRFVEELTPGIVARKILVVDDPRAWVSKLVFLACEVGPNKTPLHISVNGLRFIQPGCGVNMPNGYGDWSYRFYYIDLPRGTIQAGENDIRFWVEDDAPAPKSLKPVPGVKLGNWRLLISLDEIYPVGTGDPKAHHPNRSMKSSDGGKTWSDSKLGALNTADGEYGARFALERHVSKGEMVSAVVDAVGGSEPFKKMIEGVKLTAEISAEVPAQTAIECMARTGQTADPGAKGWGAWQPAPLNAPFVCGDGGRYVQFKAKFSTRNPLASPSLRSIRVRADWREQRTPNSKQGVAVKMVHNGRVTRSSIPFEYENLSNSELKKFRNMYRLDEVVKGASGEFDVMMRLLAWSYRIPVDEDSCVFEWDPFTTVKFEPDVLGRPKYNKEYKGRRRDAMCLVSNVALIFALESMGYQARHVVEHTMGLSGHEVVEVWSNQYNKWIHMDATRDYYYFDPDTGTPLNLWEIHQRIVDAMPRPDRPDRPMIYEVERELVHKIRIGWREGTASKVSITSDALHVLPMTGYLRYIPRNNFVSKPHPLPPANGYTEWGWNGYVNFFDPYFPRRPEYTHYSDRVVDYHEPLNQAELTINDTTEPGRIKIDVRTLTPGLDCFMVRRQGEGEWARQNSSSWSVDLAPGLNRIEVRARTREGIMGPISCFEATYNP